MYLKIYDKKTRFDYLNLTLILSIATVCLQQWFGISGMIYFIIDVPIVLLLLRNNRTIIKELRKKTFRAPLIILSLAVIAMLISAIVNHVSFVNILYGLYKYFRYFAFFFCAVILTNEQSEATSYRILKGTFVLNLVFVFLEFIVLKVNQDLIGGVFGSTIGINQYVNLFFLIVLIFILGELMNGNTKKNKRNYVIAIIIMLMISAIAEIKYFYIEFIIILIVYLLVTKRKIKALVIAIIAMIGIIIAYNMLVKMFPEFSFLVSRVLNGGLSALADLQRHYSTDFDIGRAVVFSYSNEHFLHSDFSRLFGLGIGFISSSNFVDNSFWVLNQFTHYDQIYTAYLYIEQGMVGFILYCLFFSTIGVYALLNISQKETARYATMLFCTVVGLFLAFMYNMSVHSQLAFVLYYYMAILMNKCIYYRGRDV